MWARSERGVEKCAANEVRAALALLLLLYPRGGEPTMETAAEPRKEVFVC